ncbi:MAG: FecR domain-containing protein [Bacteroidales bacterium]|jgi:ferric-dicitrate binding protein FerR (iron transport regulator)|nr:FecR domain-containing protein [Bacteroidales bacterium]MCI2121529.1 FecR domain-containing protein [Bacteroidales bacterium]MCI2145529.1 FecR domain-containing protein [Bacteroidales bacterium]
MDNINENDKTKRAIELLKRYMKDECNGDEIAWIQKWLYNNLNSRDSDDVFERIVSEMDVTGDIKAKERVRMRLERFLDESGMPSRHRKRNFWKPFAIVAEACAIVILAGVSIWLYHKTDKPENFVEMYSPSGETRHVVLPDGSKLWLRADSRIIYPEQFRGNTRCIYACGEIYAEIAKNPKRPFIIKSDGDEVKVLGTKFNLKSYSESDDVEVSLLEGSVQLSVMSSSKGELKYLLSPGNTIRVEKSTGLSERYNFDVDKYVSWKDVRTFYFMNLTLEDIVKELEYGFNTNIVIRDDELRDVRYFASFVNGETLQQILASLNADKKMKITYDHGIVILSKK